MDFSGSKVEVILVDDTLVTGFVKVYNNGQLSLEKAEVVENGESKKMGGLQTFFRPEIKSIVVLEDSTSNKGDDPDDGRIRRGKSVLKSKVVPEHLVRLNALEKQSKILKDRKTEETESGDDGRLAMPTAVPLVTEEYTILNGFDDRFKQAIFDISQFVVIGVALEGVALGRDGQLGWLQISVTNHVYMFDVIALGKPAFSLGIKEILENQNILKVFHDCRLPSDMLHNQFGVNLSNVFDTQVAGVFVYRLYHQNDWPRYTEGLAPALREHLRLPKEEINWSAVREMFKEKDEEVWLERPPRAHVIDAAVKNVRYLVRLRQVLVEKMMGEYVAGVNIYLMHVRDANNGDAKRLQMSSHLLPMMFNKIKLFMPAEDSRASRADGLVERDAHGFRVNYTCTRSHASVPRDNSRLGVGDSQKSASATDKNPNMNGHISSGGHQLSEDRNMSSGLSQYGHVTRIAPGHQGLTSSGSDDEFTERRPQRSLNEVARLEANASQAENYLNDTSNGHNQINGDVKSQMKPSKSLSALIDESKQTQAQYADLKGGSLMRALVYDQDATGREKGHPDDDINADFSLIPAGRQIINSRKKRSPVKVMSSANELNQNSRNRAESQTGVRSSSRTGDLGQSQSVDINGYHHLNATSSMRPQAQIVGNSQPMIRHDNKSSLRTDYESNNQAYSGNLSEYLSDIENQAPQTRGQLYGRQSILSSQIAEGEQTDTKPSRLSSELGTSLISAQGPGVSRLSQALGKLSPQSPPQGSCPAVGRGMLSQTLFTKSPEERRLTPHSNITMPIGRGRSALHN